MNWSATDRYAKVQPFGDIEADKGTTSSRLQRRFVSLLEHFAPVQGRIQTPWPGLHCFRLHQPTMPNPIAYSPSICIVGQGAKEARLGERVFRYDPFQYLVIRAHMPVRATIIEASLEKPFLCMSLEIDASVVNELLLEMDIKPESNATRHDGMHPLCVSPMDDRFLDAVIRLLESIDNPMDRKILAPAAVREIIYLALLRDQGDLLRLAALRNHRSPSIERALHYINHHLEERLDVQTIAREAGMSTSSLHHSFKSATTMTPIQYLKRMRLHRAQQLMVNEGCLAAEAAFRVGYESPSQFSREFKRLFGQSPRRYVESWTITVEKQGSLQEIQTEN